MCLLKNITNPQNIYTTMNNFENGKNSHAYHTKYKN